MLLRRARQLRLTPSELVETLVNRSFGFTYAYSRSRFSANYQYVSYVHGISALLADQCSCLFVLSAISSSRRLTNQDQYFHSLYICPDLSYNIRFLTRHACILSYWSLLSIGTTHKDKPLTTPNQWPVEDPPDLARHLGATLKYAYPRTYICHGTNNIGKVEFTDPIRTGCGEEGASQVRGRIAVHQNTPTVRLLRQ